MEWTTESIAQILPIAEISAANQLKEVVTALMKEKHTFILMVSHSGFLLMLVKLLKDRLKRQKPNRSFMVRKFLLQNL